MLPDGRVLWLFGDTFIGGVTANGTRDASSTIVRNSAVLADTTGRHLLPTDTPTPQPFVATSHPASWYWPGDATVEGNELRVFMSRFEATGTGAWDFAHVATDIASFHLPDLTFQGLTPAPAGNDISWGTAILETDDHTYIYGIEDLHQQKYAHLARSPNGAIRGPWEYFDGTAWSPDPAASTRIADGVSNQYSVIKAGPRFLLVNQQINFGRMITIAAAPSPWGPWDPPTAIYATPEPLTDPNLFTYNAVAHPEFGSGGELVISYNVNSFDSADIYANAAIYRPRFIRVPVCATP